MSVRTFETYVLSCDVKDCDEGVSSEFVDNPNTWHELWETKEEFLKYVRSEMGWSEKVGGDICPKCDKRIFEKGSK